MYGINHRRYRHHVLVLPPRMSDWMGPSCTWSANALVGFPGAGMFSYAWVNGDLWDKAMLYLHEIAHNYRLGHSSTFTSEAATTHQVDQEPNKCEYCDWSSTMVGAGGGRGEGCGVRGRSKGCECRQACSQSVLTAHVPPPAPHPLPHKHLTSLTAHLPTIPPSHLPPTSPPAPRL